MKFNLTAKEEYLLTQEENKNPLKDMVGETLTVDACCIHTYSTGSQVLILRTDKGTCVTSGKNFIRQFEEIFDIFVDETTKAIKIRVGTVKATRGAAAGKDMLTCHYVEN